MLLGFQYRNSRPNRMAEAKRKSRLRSGDTQMDLNEKSGAMPARRRFLAGAALGAGGLGALALTGCTNSSAASASTGSSAPNVTAAGSDLLSKWVKTGKAVIGVDTTGPPVSFRNAKGEPTGFDIELLQMMMSDIGAKITWVETPFANLIAAQAAGKIDMPGNPMTTLPSRSLEGFFASFPVFYEGSFMWLAPGSTVTDISQLANSRISVLAGSAQLYSGQLLLPSATFLPFAQASDVISEVATGRAEATLISEFEILSAASANKNMRIMSGPPVLVDPNTYFMPTGDFTTQLFITNWLRYYAAHGVLSSLWGKWLGAAAAAKLGLHLTGVGPGGETVNLD
jgi:polar amino acid transport system substrate-binding protein